MGYKMNTYELAVKASDNLNSLLNKYNWILGVGVGKTSDGVYTIEVRVPENAPVNLIPNAHMQIPVIVRTITMPSIQ